MNFLKRKNTDEGGGRRGRDSGLARRDSPGRDNWGLNRFRDEMDRAFDRVWREFDRDDPWPAMSNVPGTFGSLTDWPAIDVAEDDKALTLRADLPGLDPKDVEVEVSGNLLTIRGERETERSDAKAGIRRRERRFGSFARTLPLPDYLDADKVEARYDRGTMTITVPKVAGKGPKRVNVTSG